MEDHVALLPKLSDGIPSEALPPRWRYTIPKKVRRSENDPTVVVLRELSDAQMEIGAKLGSSGKWKVASEVAKLALWEVDGRRVDHGAAEADVLWAKWSSKVKMLLIHGYNDIHNTDEEEDASFLASRIPVV